LKQTPVHRAAVACRPRVRSRPPALALADLTGLLGCCCLPPLRGLLGGAAGAAAEGCVAAVAAASCASTSALMRPLGSRSCCARRVGRHAVDNTSFSAACTLHRGSGATPGSSCWQTCTVARVGSPPILVAQCSGEPVKCFSSRLHTVEKEDQASALLTLSLCTAELLMQSLSQDAEMCNAATSCVER
jgi:hypothetical protein